MNDSADNPNSKRSVIVLKLGGSLFSLAELKSRLLHIIDREHWQRVIIVPGGGQFADQIRSLESVHQWSQLSSHWLAIHCMSLTAKMISEMDSRFQLVTSFRTVRSLMWPRSASFTNKNAAARVPETTHDSWNCSTEIDNHQASNSILVFDVAQAEGIEHLPATWDLTSDSIAAWVSSRLQNSSLVLGKSTDLPFAEMSLQEAAEAELVDRYFPRFFHHGFESGMPSNQPNNDIHSKQVLSSQDGIGWINFRDPEFPLHRWQPMDQSGQ